MAFIPPQGDDFFTWRREQFPYFNRKIFLTHASVSPLPARSVQAIADYAGRIATEGQFDYIHDAIYRNCKARLANLIGHGATADDIAFAGSTSHALGLVATSIPWKPGDNCVVADGDFPGNVVVWKNLKFTHGVEARMIPHRPEMNLTVADIEPLLDDRTRIVSLSAANFLSGYPLDLATIGKFLHDRGILLCVDAIQMLGAVPVDVSEADFLCADSHKWLLGPNGAAVLWVRPTVLEQLRPAILGWLAIETREDWFQYGTAPRQNADCFEPGARNYLGVVGFEASLAVIQEVGIENVAARVAGLRDYTAGKLEAAGCRLLWKPEPGKRTGIVSFQKPGANTAELYKKIDERFAISIRQYRDGELWLRISPHFMNCEADIDGLVKLIEAA